MSHKRKCDDTFEQQAEPKRAKLETKSVEENDAPFSVLMTTEQLGDWLRTHSVLHPLAKCPEIMRWNGRGLSFLPTDMLAELISDVDAKHLAEKLHACIHEPEDDVGKLSEQSISVKKTSSPSGGGVADDALMELGQKVAKSPEAPLSFSATELCRVATASDAAVAKATGLTLFCATVIKSTCTHLYAAKRVEQEEAVAARRLALEARERKEE